MSMEYLRHFKSNHFSWYHGCIEREHAEELLKKPPLVSGKYLVRESIRFQGDYSLSLLTVDSDTRGLKIDHYRVLRNHDTGTIYIDEEYQFDTIHEVVNVS